jgi:hypothetical protein
VADQRTGINVPDNGNLVAIEIELGGFGRAPVGGNLGEFPDDEGFDVGTRGFFVIEIGADVADVGIGEANDLPRVTRIGKNFLIAGETRIENDFTATARDSAGSAAVKDAPVLERENCGSVQNFRCQCVLRPNSFLIRLRR